MLSLVQTSKQRASRIAAGSAAEALRPAVPRENLQQCRSITGPLATSIIHDLRNPLAAICASAEMMTDPRLTRHHADRLRRSIHKSASQMRQLLDELAGVAQGKLAASENFRLQEIVSAACDHTAYTANDQGVDIFVDLPTRMEVVLSRARMERVFINLITNALEAMPRGGTIQISASKAGGFALIAVEDSGPGIPPEIYGRLFTPFVTSGKKDGLGLGLALSRRTVRDHGGDMWIEPASGARFVIRLPLSRALPRFGHTTAKIFPH
jgi:signal transduction histidine kinase